MEVVWLRSVIGVWLLMSLISVTWYRTE